MPRVDLIKTIREYYPKYLITKDKNSTGTTEFCVSMDDSPRKPSSLDPISSTGIIFTVDAKNMTLYINHLNVNIEKRGRGIYNNLLAPLWTFYKDCRFKCISLYSSNNKFWKHIQKKFPWINFQITFNLKNE